MKRPDAVSLIAIYHFVMSVPFLIGSFALLFAMLSVLISVKPPDDQRETAGRLLATVRDRHRPVLLPAICSGLPAGRHRAVAAVAVGSLGSYRAGGPFAARFPRLDGHRRADHLVSAAGRGEASIWLG